MSSSRERTGNVDIQVPHSSHVEVIALLSNRERKPDSYVRLSLDMNDYYRIKDQGKSERQKEGEARKSDPDGPTPKTENDNYILKNYRVADVKRGIGGSFVKLTKV